MLIVITPNSNIADFTKNLTLTVPYLTLNNAVRTYMTGEYYPIYSENVYSAGIEISKTNVRVGWTSQGQNDTTEYHYMQVYYK